METTDVTLAVPCRAVPAEGTNRERDNPRRSARPWIDGKYFARGQQRLRVQGVTYGPFTPQPNGDPFPSADQVRVDLAQMRGIGINALRTYCPPPDWFWSQVEEEQLALLVDVPWLKHLCFLDTTQAQRQARQAIRDVARLGKNYSCLLGYSIGNEIPPNIVRWHGARRVERFLAELRDVAKQEDPAGLVTYANFPSTEYLDLSFLDFATFNVYLHDLETFRRYLLRLQHLVGDKPLLLGELGMDTLRQGELHQASFLQGHLREGTLMGLAGAFVFSWTDDWHAGGTVVEDWAFGITAADRSPKPAYHALREVFEQTPAELLPDRPPVSVVVCSYNGGVTLEHCLQSLLALDYPQYEVIVVDDGSTDDTPAILARFPRIRAIRQANHGLSFARNVGVRAANHDIIAYTDSDCFADADWLTHLVYQLQRSTAAAVGGPNLTPEDGWLVSCVAAAPGQPTHVLESDQVAEHIPGCNMAFRRQALEAINGFDTQYRKAGDDVDVCWRLQQAGYWITFAPGAFVWHHRRQSPRAYLRQQAGYGEAEALLRFKHPEKFTGFGDGKWRGELYGASLQGLRFDESIIYRGTFGTGLFQCIYRPGPAHWAMLPSTLEWHVGAALAGLAALAWPMAWFVVALMIGLSLAVAALQARQAQLTPNRRRLLSRLVIMGLCYAQPLVRSWQRYRTRLLAYRPPDASAFPDRAERLPWSGVRSMCYWNEQGYERTELLGLVIAYLNEHRWGKTVDSGWESWDVEIHCHPWTVVQVSTAEENHGGNKRMIRVRYQLRVSGSTKLVGTCLLLAGGLTTLLLDWPAAAVTCGLLVGFSLGIWWRGTFKAAQAVAVVDGLARSLGLIPLTPAPLPAEGEGLGERAALEAQKD